MKSSTEVQNSGAFELTQSIEIDSGFVKISFLQSPCDKVKSTKQSTKRTDGVCLFKNVKNLNTDKTMY